MNMHAKTLLAGALLSLSCFAAQAAPNTADQAQASDATSAATPDRNDPNCLRYTGSLVVANQNQRNERRESGSDATAQKPVCNGSGGHSYTQEDIRRTGATDIADALRKLDPAIH